MINKIYNQRSCYSKRVNRSYRIRAFLKGVENNQQEIMDRHIHFRPSQLWVCDDWPLKRRIAPSRRVKSLRNSYHNRIKSPLMSASIGIKTVIRVYISLTPLYFFRLCVCMRQFSLFWFSSCMYKYVTVWWVLGGDKGS